MRFIKSIEINPVAFPITKPFSNHVRKITHLDGLVIRIFTDTGIIGQGVMYGLANLPYEDVVKYIKKDLISHLLNNNEIVDSNSLHSCWYKIWSDYKSQNKKYEKLYALAAVDIAIWDIFIKSMNTSLHKYLGAAQAKIPVYGTTGWLSFSLQELIEECKSYSNKGINGFKIRIGHPDDYMRVKSIREEMGKDFIIMLDANQRYTVEQASQVAEKLSEFNISWIEEPTENSLEAIEKIHKFSKIPVALGENIIAESDFVNICKDRLAEYLQPDIPRCGGITGFIKVMQLAAAHNIPVCNHLMYELSANLISAFPNGCMLEYDNFLPTGIFASDFSVKDGQIQIPESLGTGVEITNEALTKYRVDSYSFHSTPSVDSTLKF